MNIKLRFTLKTQLYLHLVKFDGIPLKLFTQININS